MNPVDVLANRLNNLINASMDSGLTNAEMIGVLEIVKMELFQDILEDDDGAGHGN